jgi:metal-responsive CopG/Arc/MetJ family transcriptional regulator
MKKAKVTITLSEDVLVELDKLVRRRQGDQLKAGSVATANRSQVIEELLRTALRRT